MVVCYVAKNDQNLINNNDIRETHSLMGFVRPSVMYSLYLCITYVVKLIVSITYVKLINIHF